MIYVRRVKFGENLYWGEGRVYPGEAGEAECLKESRSSDLTFFLRARECNNCGENKPIDSGRGAIERRQFNLSSLVLKEVFLFVDLNHSLKI